MFGYVTPCKMELKIKDYELFKAYYCGLCKSIKGNFGNLPRMTLNYDMTFLGILLDSIEPSPLVIEKSLCILHPTGKRRIVINTKALNYAAFCNVALSYYKLVDDSVDDSSLKSKMLSYALKPYFKKFPSEFIPLLDIIKNRLKELTDLEKAPELFSLDEVAHPFSALTGELLSFNKEEKFKDSLYWLGYNLGKWIYIIDALDDLKKDMEKNKFNPLTAVYNKDNLSYKDFYEVIKDRVDFVLVLCGEQSVVNLNKLEINKNKDLLLNILELGLQEKIDKVYKGVNQYA